MAEPCGLIQCGQPIPHYHPDRTRPDAAPEPTNEERRAAARAVAAWHIGDPEWADLIIGAYLRPRAAMAELKAQQEEDV